MRTNRGYLPRACFGKAVSCHHWPLAETKGKQGSGKVYRGNTEAQISEQLLSVLCDSSLWVCEMQFLLTDRKLTEDT